MPGTPSTVDNKHKKQLPMVFKISLKLMARLSDLATLLPCLGFSAGSSAVP